MLDKMGRPAFEWGRAWDKGLTISTGQTPVSRYNRYLMNAILFDRIKLKKVLNTTAISLDEAPQAYQVFNNGAPQKFVIDPHQVLSNPEQLKTTAVAAGYQ